MLLMQFLIGAVLVSVDGCNAPEVLLAATSMGGPLLEGVWCTNSELSSAMLVSFRSVKLTVCSSTCQPLQVHASVLYIGQSLSVPVAQRV